MHQTPALDDVAPPLADGRYRLIGVLGVGGMATVYRTWDSRLQVERAVKVLSPELAARPRTRERFESEARLMARLHHPHIATVHDVGHEAGGPAGDRAFIVMELLPGGSLADRVIESGPLPPAQAAALMRDLCRALQVAHEAGVVHRDIKPHNVLLSATGQAKVTDFGIARASRRDISLTRTGAVMGTWAFMAPEIRSNAKQADARSDIYAVGASLYMVVTARQPLDLHAVNVREHILADLPPGLRRVVERATEYMPEARYASAGEMALALDELSRSLQGLPALGPDAPAAHAPPPGETTLEPPPARTAALDLPPAPTAAPTEPGVLATRSQETWQTTADERPQAPRLGVKAGLAVALVGALLVGGGAWWAGRGEEAVAAGEEVAAPGEGAVEEEVAAPVEVAVAAPVEEEEAAPAEVAAAPVAVEEPPPARREPVPVQEAAAPTAPAPGILKINSVPPGQVSIDGGALLDLPLVRGVELAPGPHELRFVGPEGLGGTTTWQVESGATAVACWDLRAGARCAR